MQLSNMKIEDPDFMVACCFHSSSCGLVDRAKS
jgi:hypothetical protein